MLSDKAPWVAQGAFYWIAVKTLLAFCLGAGLLVAVYFPGLQGDFFFDDIPNILAAETLRIEHLSLDALTPAILEGQAGPFGRPVAQISFALNYYWSGLSPAAFKAVNLAIHFICGLLVFALSLKLLTRDERSSGNAREIAFVLAACWLLHPIQLLPVLHVVQRMTSLSAFVLLAAMLLHIQGRESGKLAWLAPAWLILWPLSVLSKESGLLFPLFALCWELTLFRAERGGLDKFSRAFAAITAAALILVSIYLFSARGQWITAGYQFRDFNALERMLTEARVLWLYLGLILFPRLEAFALFHDDIA